VVFLVAKVVLLCTRRAQNSTDPFSKIAMIEQNISLDRYSLHILAELQRDARQTVQQMAERVGLSATPCWKRIKEMEAAGVITGYTALVNRETVGLNLAVVVEANISQHSEDLVRKFEAAVAASPQIVRCLATTGQSDYILTVLVAGIKEYEAFLHDTIFKLPGVTHVRSSIVLKEVKAVVALPVGAPAVAAPAAPKKRSGATRR
jgi:DNA-binding Lrp family transcriptional regulator